jgi:hypothetical protein
LRNTSQISWSVAQTEPYSSETQQEFFREAKVEFAAAPHFETAASYIFFYALSRSE